MTDYRKLFKACGENVVIDPGVLIEHPQSMHVGDNVRFFPNCFIQGDAERFIIESDVDFFPNTYISLGGGFVEIGHHTHFAPGCALYGHGGLKIGPYCNIAAHCVLATVGHDPVIRPQPMALATPCKGPITLEEDIWLGANVTVTSNVTIAKGCIIGANAVVSRSTQPFGLYTGVPAKRLRDRKKS